MPWESRGDNISFSGQLADLMGLIMTAYDQDVESETVSASAGVYVTATAIVLREILLEALVEDTDAAEFLQRVSDSLHEADDGTVTIATFAMLDDIAEHIEPDAVERWIGDPAARSAIAELATSAFAEE
jgi:hypothetical protein